MDSITLSSDKISYINGYGINSLKLLRELLSDKNYRELKRILKSDCESLVLSDPTGHAVIIPRSVAIKSYDQLILDESISEKEFDRIISLRNLINFDSFIARYKNQEFVLSIDGINYKIKTNDIIGCLLKSAQDYKLSLNGHRNDKMPLGCFLYAVDEFAETVCLKDSYVLPKDIEERLKNIHDSVNVDITAYNQIYNTSDCRLNDVVLDKEFRDEILSQIPSNLSQLEKAIYLYILLCKTFTYDPVYYAYDQVGEKTLKHKRIEYISTINKHNNKIVCYEFNSIYGYFLNQIGICYRTNYTRDDNYDKHAYLSFRVGKHIVTADSTTSILNGDLVNCKTNGILNGLFSLSDNPETVREFLETKVKVYNMFNEKKSKEALLKQLRRKMSIEKLPLKDKVHYMIETVNDANLQPMDGYGYFNRLKKEILSPEEQKNFSYIIVRYKEDETTPLRSIISYRDEDGEYKHYMYNPGSKPMGLDPEMIVDLFALERFEYLDGEECRVPGIGDSVQELDDAVSKLDILGEFGVLLKQLQIGKLK